MTGQLKCLLDKAVSGERLSPDEGLRILESHDLVAIGAAADAVSRRLHPEPYRTFNIDRNINYTNVCSAVYPSGLFGFRKNAQKSHTAEQTFV